MSNESEPVHKAEAASSTLPPDAAETLAALWLDLLQQMRASSTKQFEHDDSMLTWAIGLMGAGVFYANNLLSSAPRGLRFIALAPWILGILASLAARAIGGRRLQAETSSYLKEVLTFRGRLLLSKDLVPTLLALVQSIVRILNEAQATTHSGVYGWWLRLSLAAHVLAGAGVLTVVAVSFLGETTAALVILVVICVALITFVRTARSAEKASARSLEEAKKAMISAFSERKSTEQGGAGR